MKLTSLQKSGALPDDLVVCKRYKATTLSELGKCSDEQKANVKAVVLDSCAWVATPARRPPSTADVVYSHDGMNQFGFWNRQNFSFSLMELVNGSLVATKIINLKGENIMASTDFEKDLESAFNEAAQSGPSKINMDGEPKVGSATADDDKEAKKREREIKKQQKEMEFTRQANEIKSLASRANANYSIDPKFIENNRRRGRLLGFFTATDPVVKMSLRQTPINTGTPASPHYTLRPGVTLTSDVSEKFADGTKNIGAKYLNCETDIVFREAGPSTIVAGIVKTPAMTEISNLSELDGSRKWDQSAADSTTSVVKVLSKEALYAYLELNYDKTIQEDESIPGHTKLTIRTNEVKPKDIAGSSAAKRKFRTRIIADGRPTLVEGNYFPLETYDTINLATATAEERQAANANFAALLKQYNAKPKTNSKGEISPQKGEFSEEAKKMFEQDSTKSNPTIGAFVCTSAIVDKGETVQCKSYLSRGKNVMAKDVTKLPARKMVESKDGTSVRYVYVKSKFNEGPNPAINDSKYAAFIKRVTDASDGVDFASIASKAKKTSRSSSRTRTTVSAADKISGLEMIQLRSNNTIEVDGTASINDIFEAFRDANF